jgi:DNA-binding NarL/FixJ family response regulator
MTRTTLLLADDHRPVLDRLIRMLSSEFDILGALDDGQAVVDAAAMLKPNVIVLDISMPLLSGLEAAALIRESAIRPSIIFLTVHEDRDFVAAAFEAGGRGYVLKRRLATDLVPAIHAAMAGQTFVSPSLAEEASVRTPAS